MGADVCDVGIAGHQHMGPTGPPPSKPTFSQTPSPVDALVWPKSRAKLPIGQVHGCSLTHCRTTLACLQQVCRQRLPLYTSTVQGIRTISAGGAMPAFTRKVQGAGAFGQRLPMKRTRGGAWRLLQPLLAAGARARLGSAPRPVNIKSACEWLCPIGWVVL